MDLPGRRNDIHARLNLSEVSGTEENEVDLLLHDLNRAEYAIMPTSKDETIAWVLWHIARIEDLTMNLLVARQQQVLDDRWLDRYNRKYWCFYRLGLGKLVE